jgi:hypothetical protein
VRRKSHSTFTHYVQMSTKSKLKLFYNRQSIGQSELVSGYNQFLFLLEIFLRHLQICYFMAPFLTRRRVCNLLLLLGLANVVPRGTQDHILLSECLRLPQPGGPCPRIYIPHGQDGPVIPPGMGFPFCRLLRLARLWWRYSNPPPHR